MKNQTPQQYQIHTTATPQLTKYRLGVTPTYRQGLALAHKRYALLLIFVVALGATGTVFSLASAAQKGQSQPVRHKSQTPYTRATNIPGTVQAEAYDKGGEGVAYHDTNVANNGNNFTPGRSFRPKAGVDVRTTKDSGHGYQVGWWNSNEWVEYTVNVTQAGSYHLEARASSGARRGGSFSLTHGATTKTKVAVPRTGGYDNFRTITSSNFNLPAGRQVLRLQRTSGNFDLNWFKLSPAPAKPPTSKPTSSPQPPVPPKPVTQPTPVGIGGNWSLRFADEFNGSALNTKVWSTQRGPNAPGYGDPYNPSIESAYYTPNNVSVQDGNLALTLKKGQTKGYPYSSGMAHTGRNYSFKYGYVETRVKVPSRSACAGCWPAFWMLDAPVDSHWPPEMDVFEMFPSSMPWTVSHTTMPLFTNHWSENGAHKLFGGVEYGNPATDYTQNYHTYGLQWSPNKVQVYLDGQPGPSYTDASHITNTANYLIFNLAQSANQFAPSSQQMLVDYVRVWQ